VQYDLEKAGDIIRRTKYPGSLQFAANNILQPPTEEEMLKTFGQDEHEDR